MKMAVETNGLPTGATIAKRVGVAWLRLGPGRYMAPTLLAIVAPVALTVSLTIQRPSTLCASGIIFIFPYF